MQNDKFKFQTVANTRQMVPAKKSKKKSQTCSKKNPKTISHPLWSLFGMRIFNGIIIDYEAGHRGFEACAIFHAELAVVRVCSTVGCPVCRRFRCICRILSHFAATFVTSQTPGLCHQLQPGAVRGWVSLLRQTPDFSTSFTSSLKSCRTTEGQLQKWMCGTENFSSLIHANRGFIWIAAAKDFQTAADSGTGRRLLGLRTEMKKQSKRCLIEFHATCNTICFGISQDRFERCKQEQDASKNKP
jgi:hypothetical protein